MVTVLGKIWMPVVLSLALSICSVSTAQQTSGAPAPDSPTPATGQIEEIIVYGSMRDLREQMRIAEDLVFARFNEINSDDAFDVHCDWRPRPGSRIAERLCLSNAWREEEANIGAAVASEFGGDRRAPPAAAAYARQQSMQRRLEDEVRRLVVEDAELRRAAQQLQQAQLALSRKADVVQGRSVARLVAPNDGRLPFDAQRLYEVRVGRQQWMHPLTENTFAITNVTGEISGLRLDCSNGRRRIEYQPDVEWNIPDGWSNCSLHVSAKRDTTFQLFEFASPFQGELDDDK